MNPTREEYQAERWRCSVCNKTRQLLRMHSVREAASHAQGLEKLLL